MLVEFIDPECLRCRSLENIFSYLRARAHSVSLFLFCSTLPCEILMVFDAQIRSPAALAANDTRKDTMRSGGPLYCGFMNFGKAPLYSGESLRIYDRGVRILSVKHGQLSAVRNFLFFNMVVAKLLPKQRVSGVFLVGQHIPDTSG